jgi:DNA helicase HerA-like ATPase
VTYWPVPEGRSDGLEVTVGHAARWHEPGWPTFESDVPHAFASREIIAAPSSTELGLPSGVAPWQEMRTVSLAMLADAALMAGCAAFEVRYVLTPSPAGSGRVQMFLTAKARDWQLAPAQAAVSAACEKLPQGFAWATPERALSFGTDPPPDQIVIELRRDEEVTLPQWDYIPAEFYYSVLDDPGDGSGWPAFWRTLVHATEPVTVSLLFQRTELHYEERNTLGGIVTDLRMLSEPRTEYDFLNNPISYPACMNAKQALESWERRIQQLHRPLLARLAVRSDISTGVSIATALATAVGSASGTTGSHPMYYEPPAPDKPGDIRQANFSFDWLEILPWGGHGIWEDESAPHSLRRMPYLFGLNEAASLLVLPVPDEQGVAGMPRSRRMAQLREEVLGQGPSDGQSVRLGSALHHGVKGSPVDLPLAAINRHALVVGAPGSGKTTTLLTMLVRLWRDHHIPLLVIESVKAEYRSLLGTPGLEELQVITLGNESVSPLRLNPLAPPSGVRCEVHQSAVMASLKMALPLFSPQPQILTKALSRVYDRAGWDDDTTISEGLAPPTLRDLLSAYRSVFTEIGYEGEAKNIGLAFQTRLESLLQGSRGKLLDTVASSDFDLLLTKPLVIEMNDIQDADEKAVLAAFVLDRIRAGARNRGSSGGELRHVTVIEEAHRLLAKANVGSGDAASGDQARADSVRAFCEAIAELRSLGEGFILSSQSPSALADAAVANTGTRILHRMESSADRKVMLDDLDASEQVREAAARLRKGEAVARWPEKDETEIIQVEPDSSIDSGRQVSNEVVAERMRGYRESVIRLLPYQLCSPEICTEGCVSRTRRTGGEIAELLVGEAAKTWQEATRTGGDALTPIAERLVQEAQGHPQRAYCGAVHLSLADAAFRLRPGVDDRAVVVDAIRRAVRRAQ